MHSAPIVESGDTSTRWPPMFIDERDRRAGRAAELLRPGPAPSAETPAARRPTCCCRPRPRPVRNATTAGHGVRRRDLRDQRRRSRSMPSASSRAARSARHAAHHHDHAPRHLLDRLAVVGGSAAAPAPRADKRAHADVDVAEDDADERAPRSRRASSSVDGSNALSARPLLPVAAGHDVLVNSFRPPKSK